MATELELKLMIQKEQLPLAVEYFNRLCETEKNCNKGPCVQLMNGYFDTQDNTLMQAGITLRIRAINGDYIQTLKTRGSNRIGMHARGEWEWQVQQDKLDFSLISDEMLPACLHDRAWTEEVFEAFRTDFQRQIWLVQAKDTQIEVVCDQGAVTSPHGQDEICELELELKTGNEIELYDLALSLAQTLPVQVSTVSKAQKGVRLKHHQIELPDALAPHASPLEQGAFWYETWLVNWEAMCFYDDSRYLVSIFEAMAALAELIKPKLADSLTLLVTELRQQAAQLGDASPRVLTHHLATGQVMLAIARWLNLQSLQ